MDPFKEINEYINNLETREDCFEYLKSNLKRTYSSFYVKYYTTLRYSKEEIESLLDEALLYCISNYKKDKNAKFTTYFFCRAKTVLNWQYERKESVSRNLKTGRRSKKLTSTTFTDIEYLKGISVDDSFYAQDTEYDNLDNKFALNDILKNSNEDDKNNLSKVIEFVKETGHITVADICRIIGTRDPSKFIARAKCVGMKIGANI